MELSNSLLPVTPEKVAFRKILKAYKVLQPFLADLTAENKSVNILTIGSKIMPVINVIKKDPEPLKAVFNEEFFNEIQKLAE